MKLRRACFAYLWSLVASGSFKPQAAQFPPPPPQPLEPAHQLPPIASPDAAPYWVLPPLHDRDPIFDKIRTVLTSYEVGVLYDVYSAQNPGVVGIAVEQPGGKRILHGYRKDMSFEQFLRVILPHSTPEEYYMNDRNSENFRNHQYVVETDPISKGLYRKASNKVVPPEEVMKLARDTWKYIREKGLIRAVQNGGHNGPNNLDLILSFKSLIDPLGLGISNGMATGAKYRSWALTAYYMGTYQQVRQTHTFLPEVPLMRPVQVRGMSGAVRTLENAQHPDWESMANNAVQSGELPENIAAREIAIMADNFDRILTAAGNTEAPKLHTIMEIEKAGDAVVACITDVH